MYRILLLFPFIVANMVLHAQRYTIGLRTGVTNNASVSDLTGRLYESPDRHWGKYLNLAFRYSFTDKLSMESGLSFLEKNYGSHRTGIYEGIYSKYKNAFLEIPLKAVFRIYNPGKLNFKVFTGLNLSYWISSRVYGALPNILDTQTGNTDAQGNQLIELTFYKSKVPFDSYRYNRFQIGGTGGLEIGWTINNSLQIVLNGELYQTFTRQLKSELPAKKRERDNGYIASAGIMWSLPHSK